ncbi:amidohydrolase [Litoribacillus peritrichatus]|uniref:Amidohydrolase n=1 Tax=Litoribacillus peritrichatus TaxID=718191 RepID=A0ABP7N496_9GAMM
MTHKHHHGLNCSCCSPLSKALISRLNLSAKALHPKQNITTTGQNLLILNCGKGAIQTLKNGEDTDVKALAVFNNKILAAGDKAEVTKALDAQCSQYTTIKLTDHQTILPGLIEPHLHIVPAAIFNTWTDLSRFITQPQKINNQNVLGQTLKDTYTRNEQFQVLLDKGFYCDNNPNQWYLGAGIDPSLFTASEDDPQVKIINKESIDKFNDKFSSHPVFILNASMHIAYVNSKAIEIFLNTADDSDPGVAALKAILSEPDCNGQIFEMTQILPFSTVLPLPSLDSFKTEIKTYFDVASSRGVTSVFDAGVEPAEESSNGVPALANMPNYLYQLAKNNETPVRIGGALVVESLNDFETKVKDRNYKPIDSIKTQPASESYIKGARYPFFSLPYIKIMSDGSNQGLTGYQSKPYLCGDDYERYPMQPTRGTPNYCCSPTSTDLNELVDQVSLSDWPMMIHANGDDAIEITLNALENASNHSKRNRIEHASLLNADKIKRMATLNISPSFLIGHVGYWGHSFKNTIFGEDRANLLDLCRSALNSNIKISLHSDNAVTPMGPLRMMDQAVHRVMEADPKAGVLNENEKISRLDALKSVTIDAAAHCCVEDLVGSLEVGKYADFVILENNPLSMKLDENKPYETFRNIKVISTWKNATCYYHFMQTETHNQAKQENEAELV